MELHDINCALVDKDGVLCREEQVLPSGRELWLAARSRNIKLAVLSNTSRLSGNTLSRNLRSWWGLPSLEVITAVDDTVSYLREHPSRGQLKDMNVCVMGSEGLRSAIEDVGIALADDKWDGKKWKEVPSDVVCGLDTSGTYDGMSRAWNAVRQGARLVAANSDLSYRSSSGVELPAAGPSLAYLATAKNDGKPDMVLGKPHISMAEQALHRFGMTPESARIAVIGDNIREDMGLAANLRESGWQAEGWLVLTGVATAEHTNHPHVQRVFEDIREITQALLASRR